MKKLMKIQLIIFTLLLLVNKSYSQQINEDASEVTSGVIQHIDEQNILVLLHNNEEVTITNDASYTARDIEFQTGDRVILQKYNVGENQTAYYITDFQRTPILLWLFIAFSIFAVIVGKKYGFYSLVGMGFSFFIIIKFILPQILSGKSPVFITVIASIFIIPVTFYLSHGINKKTHVAVFSTLVALIITSVLTAIIVNTAKLTGYSSDDALFLQVSQQNINMKGILLAGIIIGFLGVLDDVTVSQSSVVMQLKKTNENLGTLELYTKAMEIGRDHISSMINTLVLVYAGASLPLLLIFYNNPQPLVYIINIEMVSEEVVRTLLGSIGLILAVPITTFIASIIADV